MFKNLDMISKKKKKIVISIVNTRHRPTNNIETRQ